ncbi:hypothetical protein DVH24_002536 [Malus domestica]|uniref:Uncharacterized protein n=1 Tax=Malus domestica TaxID=3750 RepID=A0A498IPJ6_MALDO|nr:hypothetical protein DVH24_002536 [Malus domestica]
MCLICTCPPPYSTRHFGSSLASGSIGTSKLSEFGRKQSQDASSGESNHRMDDPLGSSRVNSQKRNREGVVGAQSGQYRAMAEPV